MRKEDIQNVLKPSPDRADALALAVCQGWGAAFAYKAAGGGTGQAKTVELASDDSDDDETDVRSARRTW